MDKAHNFSEHSSEDEDDVGCEKGTSQYMISGHHEEQKVFKSPREWILAQNEDILFINKPAGVSMQGPGKESIQELLEGPLKLCEDDQLKLVHRLDQCVSGVVMLARNADSAAQLAACFRNRTNKALAQLEEQYLRRQGVSLTQPLTPATTGKDLLSAPNLSVERTYWALVQGKLLQGTKGMITLSVADSLDRGAVRKPALTNYRVVSHKDGFSWVELKPATGRRHQLRYHCFKGLHAPILGDIAYGFRGHLPTTFGDCEEAISTDGRPLSKLTKQIKKDQPIMLHAREMVVRLPGQKPLRVVAPLPQHIIDVFLNVGFNLPED